LAFEIVFATTVQVMAEHYGVVLVPNASLPFEAGPSAHDIIAQQQREGWQLISSRVDQYGAEIMVFRRTA
jgi:hypothetical protein